MRSSSLLEDSQYHPFAGVYSTLMRSQKQSRPVFKVKGACKRS
ncbi:MAG: hypothetical protein IPG53_14865 [Ignavibacteriales bacterium]|nr:hypothetical protein [Ignavibacteriales bacterium]